VTDLVPDAEKVLSKHLREHTDARVVGKTPQNTDDAWVRLTLLDDPAVDGARHERLIEAYVQLDCYAGEEGGQPEANNLSREVRAGIVGMPEYAHADGVVVTGATARRRRSPDATFDGRERVIVTARVWMHS
jgi:hypothetical protein